MYRYYYSFKEMDGDWSPWYECGKARYEELTESSEYGYSVITKEVRI